MWNDYDYSIIYDYIFYFFLFQMFMIFDDICTWSSQKIRGLLSWPIAAGQDGVEVNVLSEERLGGRDGEPVLSGGEDEPRSVAHVTVACDDVLPRQ